MKKALLAVTFAAVSGYAYVQAPAQEPAKGPAAAEIKVEKIVTAASVENREPVDETSAFDKSTGKVYTWTRITATATPVKIKHVYYFNEQKEREIELSIGGSPWRVWSAKNVRPGNWKVEVTDEAGEVLTIVTFTVSSAAPVQAPETETPTQGK